MLLKIAMNACAWTLIQLGLVAIANLIPLEYFSPCARDWERRGRIYNWLGVRAWKSKLPDAGSWFPRAFSKQYLGSRSFIELERFSREASRGELVHWCAVALLPLFAFWNGWPGMSVNAIYAIAANLPCIIAQRFNRARIAGLLKRLSKKGGVANTAVRQRRLQASSKCPSVVGAEYSRGTTVPKGYQTTVRNPAR